MARKIAGLSFRTEHGAVRKDSFHPQATQERILEPEAQHALPVDGIRQSKPGNTQYQQCFGGNLYGYQVETQGTQWNQKGQQKQVSRRVHCKALLLRLFGGFAPPAARQTSAVFFMVSICYHHPK